MTMVGILVIQQGSSRPLPGGFVWWAISLSCHTVGFLFLSLSELFDILVLACLLQLSDDHIFTATMLCVAGACPRPKGRLGLSLCWPSRRAS